MSRFANGQFSNVVSLCPRVKNEKYSGILRYEPLANWPLAKQLVGEMTGYHTMGELIIQGN